MLNKYIYISGLTCHGALRPISKVQVFKKRISGWDQIILEPQPCCSPNLNKMRNCWALFQLFDWLIELVEVSQFHITLDPAAYIEISLGRISQELRFNLCKLFINSAAALYDLPCPYLGSILSNDIPGPFPF